MRIAKNWLLTTKQQVGRQLGNSGATIAATMKIA